MIKQALWEIAKCKKLNFFFGRVGGGGGIQNFQNSEHVGSSGVSVFSIVSVKAKLYPPLLAVGVLGGVCVWPKVG